MINRFGLRGAGIWALGYDGTRPELYAVIVDKFLHDTTPPETGVAVLRADPGRRGVPGRLVGGRHERHPGLRRPGLGRRWALDGLADADHRHPRDLLGHDGHRYAVRARATDAKGNVGAWDVTSQPDPRPSLAKGGFGTVRSSSLSVRVRPDTSAASLGKLAVGDVVSIIGGPATADGYTWYQVSGPLSTWAPVRPVRFGGWVAAKRGGTAYLAPRTAPNTTLVAAGIAGLSFGSAGAASVGNAPAALAARAFSPDGDGSEDGLTLRWRNAARPRRAHPPRPAGRRRGGSRQPERPATGPAARRPGPGTARSGASGCPTAATSSSSSVATAAGPTALHRRTRVSPTRSARSRSPWTPARRRSPRRPLRDGLLSPNGDGRLDAVTVSATTTGDATRWRLSAEPLVAGSVGASLRSITGSGPAPRTAWDGRTNGGAVAPDGRYRLTLTVLDDAGNAAARSWEVTLDATPPKPVLATEPAVFSPDRDGVDDTAVIRWTAAEPASATIQVLRGRTVVRTFAGAPSTTGGAARWNGRDAHGRPVADGAYVVRVVTTDAAGNRAVATVGLRVDRTAGWLRWSPGAIYAADHDGLAKSARISFKLTRTATTTLQLLDGAGTVVRTAWSGRRLKPGSTGWAWDGRDAARAFVPAGTYLAVLTARTSLGTVTMRRAIFVDAFVTTLSATVLKAGQTLIVSFQTTEPLKGRPAVTFDQSGLRPVTRTATLVAPGRYRITFKVAASGVGAATIRIVARDTAGGLNASTRALTIR